MCWFSRCCVGGLIFVFPNPEEQVSGKMTWKWRCQSSFLSWTDGSHLSAVKWARSDFCQSESLTSCPPWVRASRMTASGVTFHVDQQGMQNGIRCNYEVVLIGLGIWPPPALLGGFDQGYSGHWHLQWALQNLRSHQCCHWLSRMPPPPRGRGAGLEGKVDF